VRPQIYARSPGQEVLLAAKQVDTKPVVKRFTAFRTCQSAYVRHDEKVKRAVEAETEQERRLGEKDAAQDEAVDGLAASLAGDGLPRTNPFKPFGVASPSVLKITDAVEEAKTIIKLAGKIAKYAGASARSRAAAKKAANAARAVLAAAEPLPALRKKVTAAMTARGALAPAWEKAFAVLKRAARTAQDDGAPGLYDALFVRATAKATKKGKGTKRTPAQPAIAAPPAPSGPTNGAATP
jgi:hypothetical protein